MKWTGITPTGSSTWKRISSSMPPHAIAPPMAPITRENLGVQIVQSAGINENKMTVLVLTKQKYSLRSL